MAPGLAAEPVRVEAVGGGGRGAWFWRTEVRPTLWGLAQPWDAPAIPGSALPQEFWVRLLCYIMETDYTEALTPICVSLTNLAERQLHAHELEAGTASKPKHGGQRPGAGLGDWAGAGCFSPPGSVPATGQAGQGPPSSRLRRG